MTAPNGYSFGVIHFLRASEVEPEIADFAEVTKKLDPAAMLAKPTGYHTINAGTLLQVRTKDQLERESALRSMG
jgi:hypothetical protein